MLRWPVVMVGLLLLAAAPARAARFTDADYWAFAERSFEAIDGWWVPAERAYVEEGHRTPQVRTNAGLLTIHGIAAVQHHRGLARNDSRARDLADRLTSNWVGRRRSLPKWSTNSETHCWSSSMNVRNVGHASIDAQVAEALGWAWRARDVIGLDRAVARRIERQLRSCARHPYWRWPAAVSTQVNWNAQIYAAAASATGDDAYLRRDFRRLAAWFARGIERRVRHHRTTNLGPGYAFRYLPVAPASHRFNSDVPEYANLVVQFLEHYDRALRAGMRPLAKRSVTLLRAWVRRLLAGSWTHAGFLNWDTGYGMQRWMSAQYWAFAQQGLIAIASSPRFRSARAGRWAKAMLDQALLLYRGWADRAGGPLAPGQLFGFDSKMDAEGIYHVRMVLNAVRAVARGLGRRPSADPPPLYAFDPDTGRLAVSTPRYSTAIVPDSRGAFPYGGIELARLFGPRQRPIANLSGVPPAAFGAVLADAAGRPVLESQRSRSGTLRILRSPHGAIRRPRRYPARPYAGPFSVLEARGTLARGGARVTSTHRFTRAQIRSSWRLRCPRRCASARIMFPSWGAQTTIDVVYDSGARVRLSGPYALPGATPLAGVARIEIGSGYAIVPVHAPRGATLSAAQPPRQTANPDPGPTLAVDVPARAASLAVRLVPAR